MLKSGDLVYLPAAFILTKRNSDGTVSQYLETKVPYRGLLLKMENNNCSIFYRGETWNAPVDMVLLYNKGEDNASYAN